MGKTVQLDDVEIIEWGVNVQLRSVTVVYSIKDDSGDERGTGNAVFWETLPTPPTGAGPDGKQPVNPDNWYQLPVNYGQLLTGLTVDIRSALLHLLD